MAQSEFYHDVSLERVSQLRDFRVHNVTTAQRGTLASALNSTHEGLHVWDTEEKLQYYWNGSAFIQGITTVVGGMVYKGTTSSLTVQPTAPQVGYQYIYTGAPGTLTWTDQTFFPDAEISTYDQLLYRAADTWDIIQGDVDYATETEAGIIDLATQSEVNAGTGTGAIIPGTLAGFATNKAFAKTYFVNSVSVTANTAFTVNHALNTQNKDSFVISIKNTAGSEISLDVDSVDTNNLTITSAVSLTGLKVCVVGF